MRFPPSFPSVGDLFRDSAGVLHVYDDKSWVRCQSNDEGLVNKDLYNQGAITYEEMYKRLGWSPRIDKTIDKNLNGTVITLWPPNTNLWRTVFSGTRLSRDRARN